MVTGLRDIVSGKYIDQLYHKIRIGTVEMLTTRSASSGPARCYVFCQCIGFKDQHIRAAGSKALIVRHVLAGAVKMYLLC